MGACPPVVAGIFSKFNRTENREQYAICDDIWLCSVEYSACVSGFWGLRPRPHRGSAPGPRWGTSVPQTPSFVPLSKFLATPLVMRHRFGCYVLPDVKYVISLRESGDTTIQCMQILNPQSCSVYRQTDRPTGECTALYCEPSFQLIASRSRFYQMRQLAARSTWWSLTTEAMHALVKTAVRRRLDYCNSLLTPPLVVEDVHLLTT